MEETSKTLMASVLFLDIVDYSKMGVGDQVKLKQQFNAALLSALETLAPGDRVVSDTGDGAAITILGDPERALLVAIAIFDNIGDLRVRGGVNLGPVSLSKDINGQANVLGDGINVAQRVMAFAKAGELLVSRSFHEVVVLLSADYEAIFSPEGTRMDKHGRAHEVHAVRQGVRVARRMAELQSRLATQRSVQPAPRGGDRAQVSDAGSHLMVSGYSEAAVQAALEELGKQGRKLTSPISRVGDKWLATVDKPEAEGARVEQFGLQQMISGPTRESVEAKLKELQQYGARLVQDIEEVDGLWTALCEKT
jgi:class 3 adenylate cyclase